jgi:hypothetical protein
MENADTIPHPDLLAEIRTFCAARGMATTRFGKEALSDPAFVSNLEAGRECRRATINKVRAFMAASGDVAGSAPKEAAE